LLGEYQAALQSYEAAAAQATEADMGRLEHKLGHVYERRGNRELAESHYCAALARYHAADQENEQARLNVDRSRVAYQVGHFDSARSLAEEALRLAEKTNDTVAEAQAHNTLGILARQSGEPAVARVHLERSLALSEAAGATSVRVAALNNMARLFESDGEIDEALALLEQAITLCTREGDRHREAALYNHRADIFHRAGREEASMTSLKQAVAIYAEIGMESGDWQPEIWKLTEW
jgi:tetratricopeptide (TPR) repeat protein